MEVKWELFTAFGGMAIAVFSNIKQLYSMNKSLKTQNEQAKNQFFADYTKRNQELILHFPANIAADDFTYETLDTKERDTVMRYMKAYFNLCSEEYYLYMHGVIDNYVWNEWKAGMTYAFNKPAFRIARREIYKDVDFNIDFQKFADSLMHTKK